MGAKKTLHLLWEEVFWPSKNRGSGIFGSGLKVKPNPSDLDTRLQFY